MTDYLLFISEPWLQYAIRLHLLGGSKEALVGLKSEALKDTKIKAYLKDITNFHGTLVTNHKKSDLQIHKLLFLLDIGFGVEVPEIAIAVNQIMSHHKDKSGVYQFLTNIPQHGHRKTQGRAVSFEECTERSFCLRRMRPELLPGAAGLW